MKTLSILLACLLTGCASEPPLPQTVAQCDKLAWYARAVATLRDVGVEQNDIAKYMKISNNTIDVFDIQVRVYETKSKTPADIYIIFYAMCINDGYYAVPTVVNVLNANDQSKYLSFEQSQKNQR